MIVAIVGTHGQPMVRMIDELDAYARDHPGEEVVIQGGSAASRVQYGRAVPYMPQEELRGLVHDARIVVTHGGPSLLLELIDSGCVPIVMPRERQHGEHVDDHQVAFAEFLASRGLAIVARSATDLRRALDGYRTIAQRLIPDPLPAADPGEAARSISALMDARARPGRGGVVRALFSLTGQAVPLAIQRGLPALTLIAMTVLVTHRTDGAEVGRWAVLAGLVSVARVAADFGLDKAVPRTIAMSGAWSAATKRAFGARLVTGTIASIAVLVLASALIGLGVDVLIAASLPLLQAPTVLATAWAIAGVRSRRLLGPALLGSLTAIGVATITSPSAGIVGFVGGLAIGGAIEGAAAWWRLGVQATGARVTRAEVVAVLRDASGFGIQGVLGVLYARIPVLLLAALAPALVVSFALGYNLYAAIALGSSALALTTFARLNRAVADGSHADFLRATRQYALASGSIALMAVLLAFFAERIIDIVYTSTYASAASVARWLMLTVPVSMANGYLSVALFALRADRIAVGFSAAAVGLLGALTIIAIPLGVEGPALALLVTESAIAVAAAFALKGRLRALG